MALLAPCDVIVLSARSNGTTTSETVYIYAVWLRERAATRPARWSIREDGKRALVARAGVRAMCARAVVCSRHPFRHVPAARSRSDRELVLAHFAGRERVHQLGQSSRRCRRYACAERAAHVCTDESPRRHPLFADGMSSEKPPGSQAADANARGGSMPASLLLFRESAGRDCRQNAIFGWLCESVYGIPAPYYDYCHST